MRARAREERLYTFICIYKLGGPHPQLDTVSCGEAYGLTHMSLLFSPGDKHRVRPQGFPLPSDQLFINYHSDALAVVYSKRVSAEERV